MRALVDRVAALAESKGDFDNEVEGFAKSTFARWLADRGASPKVFAKKLASVQSIASLERLLKSAGVAVDEIDDEDAYNDVKAMMAALR